MFHRFHYRVSQRKLFFSKLALRDRNMQVRFFAILNFSRIYLEFLKFIYSEKATKFCEIFPLLLTVCTVVKSKGTISQNFVAFSECMNFTIFLFMSFVTKVNVCRHIVTSFQIYLNFHSVKQCLCKNLENFEVQHPTDINP